MKVSRTATGFTEGSSTELGTSDFAALTGLGLGAFAAEFGATDKGPLLPKPEVGLLAATVAPGAPLEASVPPEAGFAAELLAGLAVPMAVAFAAGPEGELCEEPAAGPVAEAAGLIAEFVDVAGFEVCGCFGDGAAAEGALAPAAGFAGVGGFNALRTASGVAGTCCAINGVASDAKQKTISQVARFACRMILC